MTIPVNIRWLIFGGLALLLIGLALGYLAFYPPKYITPQWKPGAKPARVDRVEGVTVADSQGNTHRVDTITRTIPCQQDPEGEITPVNDVKLPSFSEIPSGIPGIFGISAGAHMPAFTIHQAQPLITFGAKLGMDPIQGFWAGSAIARLSLGDFHVLAELGLMRDLFFALVAIEVYFYSIDF